MRKYIYADESGNFDFSRNQKATRYFILTTVLMEDHAIAAELLDLRRELVWNGVRIGGGFHATEDKQLVRNLVFDILDRHEFRVDATLLEKAKAAPRLRTSDMRFYKYAWFYHMKYVAPHIATTTDELMVIAASVSTRQKMKTFHDAINDVMDQVSPTSSLECAMWPAATDPCLQVADYCSWAIQRKWEGGDSRPYDRISDKIKTVYDLFGRGTVVYY